MALAADVGMLIVLRCIVRVNLGSALNVVLTITNIATKVLFAIQVARGTDNPSYTAYLAIQLLILVASHASGLVVIGRLMRSELRVAKVAPGREHLDVEEFHRRPSLYTLSLLIGSANLQVLAVLPWKERTFSGMPSEEIVRATYFSHALAFGEKIMRATYVSLAFGDLPQLCLQITYLIVESDADPVVSGISLVCTGLSLFYRVAKQRLTAMSARALSSLRSRVQREAVLRSNVRGSTPPATVQAEPLLDAR